MLDRNTTTSSYRVSSLSHMQMEEMKVSSESAVPLDQTVMQGVKEIEPWAIFEQTAWEYARTMVEEEVGVMSRVNA